MNRLVLGLVIALLASAASGETVDNKRSIEAGKALAMEVCSVCHVVSPGQLIPPELASIRPTPSFEEIANDSKTSASFLRSRIATPHGDENSFPLTMPNPMLMEKQREDVVRYILSLRKRR